MSRARDNANLGAQAGSGLDASDITTGVLPVGVTGGSGLNAVNPTNLAAGLFGAIERTSLTSPDTITATCTLGDTLDSAGSISADLFGSSNATLFGSVSQTNAAITFDYGSGVTKYLRYIEWKQVDGGGNSTGIKIRGSNATPPTSGGDWTDITTIASAIVNGTTYSFTNTGTTGYRYWQVQYTWSSGNYCSIHSLKIHESDSSTLTTLSPATSFPAGHIIKSGLLYNDQDLAGIATTSTSFTDTGIGGSIITVKASSASRLSFHVFIGMSHVTADDNAQTALCLRSSASSTTYALGDDLTSSTASYRNYERGTAKHHPAYKETHYKAGVNTPTSLTSYTAGETLYWRYFMKISGGTVTWAQLDSHMTVEYKEMAL